MFMRWREKFAAILVFSACLAPTQAQDLDQKADERMRRVIKILRTTNKAQVNQFVPVAFDLKSVNPYDVIRFIRRPIEAEEGNWWTFMHPEGNKGRLLINVPTWLVEPMKELIAVIDRPGLNSSGGDKREYVKLRHRDPGDPGFLSAVQAEMASDSIVLPDRATGALFLQDAPSGLAIAMDKIAKELDVPTPQLTLRVKIYELDVNNDATIGTDYTAWKNGPGRNLFAVGAFGENYKASGGDAPLFNTSADARGLPGHTIKNHGYNTAYFYDVPSAFFDFLVTKGKARVLTQPQTTVRTAEKAVFRTGEDIPYYLVQNGPSDLAGVRPANLPLDPYGKDPDFPDNRTVSGATVARKIAKVAESGIQVEVAPTIAQKDVILDLFISNVSQTGFDDTGVPQLQTQEVDTQIRAIPGVEYIIGGLTRTRLIQSSQKMPVLGSLPVLGYLFGKETTTGKKSTAVIVVSATPVEDFSGLTPEERQMIETAKSSSMDDVAAPKALYGFDMKKMDHSDGR